MLAAAAFLVVSFFTSQSRAQTSIATDPNLKVAFIGDSGYGAEFQVVLTLIQSEGADIVLHQGDFDYSGDADGFFQDVDSILGPTFPYFASVGNHDIASWPTDCGDTDGCYAQFLKDRMATLGIVPDDPDLNDQMYSVTYRGLKMIFVGQSSGAGDSTYAPYINNQLSGDDHIWKICSWHKNQRAMPVGGKSDQAGWAVYETCKDSGAIVATGHEHSYHRTKTLTSMVNQTIDSLWPSANNLRVTEGASFAFVSGLGGKSIRDQERCLPTAYPYGCNGEWASIYTSDQGAQHGALFITFNVDGDPNKAHGYFKNVSGEVVDEFAVIATTAGAPPYGVSWMADGTPASMNAAQLTNIDLSFANTGSMTWPSGGADPVRVAYHWRAGACPGGGMVVWDGIRTALPADVVSGASASDLSTQVLAPASAGTYCLEYDLVQEGVTWFSSQGGSTLRRTVTVDALPYGVSWTADDTPASMNAAQLTNIDLSFANTGSMTWPSGGADPVRVAYHWRAGACPGGGMVVWDGIRTALPADVVSGGSVSDLSTQVLAPASEGIYCLEYDLVQEGVTWFSSQGGSTLRRTVTIN